MKAFKGFNQDMTCTPNGTKFQYEEGKEYEMDSAECCDHGFHACEYPLDCLDYYSPNSSVYREVELDGKISRKGDGDTKVAASKIKIGVSLNIAGLVKAAIEYTTARIDKTKKSDEDYGASSATGDYGASSATGYKGASSATGNCGASSATGYKGASSATGDYGASSATGDYGASSATGDYGASSATGDYGASSATGDYGASSATGYKGASSATGDYGASSATGNCGASSATGYKGASEALDKDAVAVAWGYKGKARGVLGSYIVLAEWNGDEDEYFRPDSWELKDAKIARVDGEVIKENVYYTLINGEFTEVD
ncbi:DUF7666 domain-containing protein [Kineothrix sedimenti]|uniref:DUF7666 domain-containing protein n=1 Tax=Kineothrix sedimenti TaxID=3123317 RepID=A0ABZ3EU89_9FIRM